MSIATVVRERPILFSGPMVRALLDGLKTQTRRVVKGAPVGSIGGAPSVRQFPGSISAEFYYPAFDLSSGNGRVPERTVSMAHCPYGQAGDRLWVRETFAKAFQGPGSSDVPYLYRADLGGIEGSYLGLDRWRPSIHMPRAASRLTIEITDVRVERLQEITHIGAIDEGVLRLGIPWLRTHFPAYMAELDATSPGSRPPIGPSPRERFAKLWDSLNASRGFGWDVNPYVWVLSFARVTA